MKTALVRNPEALVLRSSSTKPRSQEGRARGAQVGVARPSATAEVGVVGGGGGMGAGDEGGGDTDDGSIHEGTAGAGKGQPTVS